MSMCSSGVNTCAFLWLVQVWLFQVLLDKNSFLDNVNLDFLISLTVIAMLKLCQALWCLSHLIDSGNNRDGGLTFLILIDIKSVQCSACAAEQACCVGRVEMALCKARSDKSKNGLWCLQSMQATCRAGQLSSAQLAWGVLSCWAAFHICILCLYPVLLPSLAAWAVVWLGLTVPRTIPL